MLSPSSKQATINGNHGISFLENVFPVVPRIERQVHHAYLSLTVISVWHFIYKNPGFSKPFRKIHAFKALIFSSTDISCYSTISTIPDLIQHQFPR